jgi:hypothetical protein
MKRLVLVPHNMGSRSAKELAALLSTKLGHRVLRVKLSRVARRIPFVLHEGTDKLTQFRKFEQNGISIPCYSADRATALSWLPNNGVVCRTMLRSSEGRGIVMAATAAQVVPAPLYTQYVKKKKEFRVHVFNGKVIDVQEKRKKNGNDGTDNRIRNLANGYVFCREQLVEPTGLRDLAIQATNALGYNLGAVDIAFNEHHNKLYVLEVNACPGLQGSTLENYANAIVGWYRGQQNAL